MNIQITENEVKHLLNALSIYEWVTNSPHEESDPGVDEFCQSLLQKLSTAGVKEPIQKEDGNFTVSEPFFQELFESYIEPYNDNVFWTDLSSELAQRDLELEYSPKEVQGLKPEDVEKRLNRAMQEYDEEFEKNGVDRLFLKV